MPTPTLDDVATGIHALTGHSPVIDQTMRLLADDLIYGVLVVLALLWMHRDGLRTGLAVGLGGALALGLGALAGTLWVEPRPFVSAHFAPLIAHAADGSFPSDHLIVLGAVTGACLVRARRLALPAGLLALLVAVGRVYTGVHYPVDVAAGFILGAGCGLAAWFAVAPLVPLLDGVDRRLARLHLRPPLVGGATRAGSPGPRR